MRESLLQYLGIPFVSQALPNDDMVVEKTIEPGEGSLPGTTVLKALCTVNGGFGRMNRKGAFEVIHIKGLGVFPEDSQGTEGNLYPEETLYRRCNEVIHKPDGVNFFGLEVIQTALKQWKQILFVFLDTSVKKYIADITGKAYGKRGRN